MALSSFTPLSPSPLHHRHASYKCHNNTAPRSSSTTPSTAPILKSMLLLGPLLLLAHTQTPSACAFVSAVKLPSSSSPSFLPLSHIRGGANTNANKKNTPAPATSNTRTYTPGSLFFKKRAGGGGVDSVQVERPVPAKAPLSRAAARQQQKKEQQQQPQPQQQQQQQQQQNTMVEMFQNFNPLSFTTSTTTVKQQQQQEEEASLTLTPPIEDSEPLTLTSAIALVAGTTVGAGILALPAFTIRTGFLPSSLVLVGAWLYMVTTGLLIAEVNLNMSKGHTPDGGLISMARRTIGPSGANAAGGAYLFLHYALLVAYIAQGGDILTSGLQGLVGESVTLPRQFAPVLFTGVLGTALAFGKKKVLDQANDALVGLVVLTFLGLVAVAGPKADPSALLHADWSLMLSSVPVMFVALVFHNVIPVITYRLKGDAEKVKTSVVVGSGIPLLMFLAWNAVVLGNISPSILNAVGGANGGIVDPLAVLRSGGAGDVMGKLISVFSEIAIITSFYGFVFGLKDFLKDTVFAQALAKSGNRHLSHKQDLLAYALILAPPLTVAVISPDIFFSALDNAGAFGICVLFGIIPAVMAAIVRYRGREDEDYLPLVPGGMPVLAGVGLVAAFVIVQKAVELLG